MKTITVLNDNRTIADKIEEIEKKGWKYVKCEDVHDEHDIPYGDRMLLAGKAKLYFEQEQEMQALDAKLDPDGLDKEGQQAWEEYQDEEEFGTPNAAYCQSMEPGHNGGWFCYHPDCVTSHDEGLCEGCHRKEEICIYGGIPDEF